MKRLANLKKEIEDIRAMKKDTTSRHDELRRQLGIDQEELQGELEMLEQKQMQEQNKVQKQSFIKKVIIC